MDAEIQTDLAARLEAAPEGSRELSNAVLIAAGWTREDPACFAKAIERAGPNFTFVSGWIRPGETAAEFSDGQQTDPTRVLDDIVALFSALPEWHWVLKRSDHRRGFFASATSGLNTTVIGDCATPALALSAALVRAVGIRVT